MVLAIKEAFFTITNCIVIIKTMVTQHFKLMKAPGVLWKSNNISMKTKTYITKMRSTM